MSNIFRYISKIFRIFSIYGFFQGIIILIKFLIPNDKKISLPNIKYPFLIRNIPTDKGIFHQIFIELEYDIPLDLSSNPTIIDAGSNIGLFSVYIKNKFPNSNIICIEPDQDNFNLLKQNTKDYFNISYENSGLWNSKTKIKVYDKYNTGKSGLIVEEDDINGNIEAVSVDFLIEKYNLKKIDLIKIDIETSEIQLFKKNYQNWIPKCKYIIIELHDRIEVGCSTSFFNAIHECLPNYKFEVRGENIIIENLDF